MRVLGVVALTTFILTGCSMSFEMSTEVLAVKAPSDSAVFLKSFESNLVSAGLTESEAAFVAKRAGSGVIIGKPGDAAAASVSEKITTDWASMGENTIKHSLAALSSTAYFASTERRIAALQAVTVAHFTTISSRVSASELPGVMGRISEVAAIEIDETGLTGSDLETAMSKRADSLATALLTGTISADYHSNVIKMFTSGTVRGLGNNPALVASSAALASAAATGMLRAVGGDDGVLTDGEKGLIIRELLQGVKDGLDALPSLPAGDRADFFSDVATNAQTTLVTVAPTLAANVAVIVAVVQNEMPDVVIPPMPTPTPTPTPAPSPTPDPNATPAPTPTPAPSIGTPVSSQPISCSAHVGANGNQKPTWNVHSSALCESYCDVIANNFSGSTVVCRVQNVAVREYSAPRTPTYTNQTEPIACAARITNSRGATDYKPATVVNKAACISFCDGVNPQGGLKVCYGDGRSIKEYWGKGVE